VRGIHAYRSAVKNGEWPTLTEAAAKLGVSSFTVRRLIREKILLAEQVVPDAPYQIRASDLEDERITTAISRKGRPCRSDRQQQLPTFSDI
jgi:hypothetical protein